MRARFENQQIEVQEAEVIEGSEDARADCAAIAQSEHCERMCIVEALSILSSANLQVTRFG